jgi:hypothetical protein
VSSRPDDGDTPSGDVPGHRRRYARLSPGDRIEVKVVQPDGGRELVVGKLDAVPKVAGGCAMRIVVCDAQITVLPAKSL